MKVILFNTSNGSAFEMQFTNARQMKNYWIKTLRLSSWANTTAIYPPVINGCSSQFF